MATTVRTGTYLRNVDRWLARYLDGERDVVWHELRQLDARVQEPVYASEAQARTRAHDGVLTTSDALGSP